MSRIYFFQFLIISLCSLYIIRYSFPLFNLPTTLLEILLFVYFLIVGIDFAKAKFPWKKLKTDFDIPIGLLLLAGLISIIVSPDKWAGLGIFRAYFLEPILFYYSLIYTRRKSTSEIIIFAFLTAAIWLSLLGFLQKMTGQFTLTPHELAQGRITAVYNSANSLALILGPIMFLILGFFWSSKKNRYLSIGLFILFSVIILWTKSRGGLVAEASSLLIFCYGIFATKYKQIRKYWILFPVVLTILLVFFFIQTNQTYYDSKSTINDNQTLSDTLEIRYKLWVGTYHLLRDHPIFGAGLNGFKTVYAEHYKLSQKQEELQYPHNLILNFWAETGLLGFLSFTAIFFILFKQFLLKFKTSKSKTYGVGIICAFCYILMHGMVDVPYFKNDLSLEFWVMLALFQFWKRSED